MQNNGTDRIWELMSGKLSGEASTEELAELSQLLKAHPEHAYSLEIMEDLWLSEPPVNRQYSEYKYKELLNRMQKMDLITCLDDETDPLITLTQTDNKNVTRIISRILMIAASVILILMSVVFYYSLNNKNDKAVAFLPQKKEVVTKNASKTNIILPDGTKVWLNAGSKLTYDENYGNRLREVVLTGEAFFDVTKNAAKPFIIHTRKMDIKVLGTAFNVRSYSDEKKVETSLLRGSIEVTLKDRPTEKIYLKPNEKLTLIDEPVVSSTIIKTTDKKVLTENGLPEPMVAISHLTYTTEDSMVIETSWLQNKLIFKSETFEEVAKKMERWYNVRIVFSEESIKRLHFTGIFENESIEEALAAMQITTPFHYTICKKNLITISK